MRPEQGPTLVAAVQAFVWLPMVNERGGFFEIERTRIRVARLFPVGRRSTTFGSHRMRRTSCTAKQSRLRPLAAGIASFLALSAPAAFAANTLQVTNCNDAGAGSLRDTIAAAASGDTVSLAGLACVDAKISLTTAEIIINQADLTITGPGKAALTIDGTGLPAGSTNYSNSRLFTHKGNGTLTINALHVANGHVYHSASGYASRGGCIYSAKNVSLQSVDVDGCSAFSQADKASGGGVYAKGDVTLTQSTVNNNAATGGGYTQGGGVATPHDVVANSSTISGNTASASAIVRGGGIYAHNALTLDHSTVSANTASASAGFAEGGGIYTRYDQTISFSTVSGNKALGDNAGAGAGGTFGLFGTLSLFNSTVDGNYSAGAEHNTGCGGACSIGNMRIVRSTVSGNWTTGGGGGISKGSNCTGCDWTFYMRDSTVSGNHAGTYYGGVAVTAAHMKLYSSTIAFNTSEVGKVGTPGNYSYISPGLHLNAFLEDEEASIHSMLISNNTYGAGVENDLTVSTLKTVSFNAGPAHSLIGVTSAPGLPSGVVTGVCPLLGPLRDNGGLTRTHALLSGSPAIDTGDSVPVNMIGIDLYDQRGSAADNGVLDYLRFSGPLGDPEPVPDIGAHEVQQDDIVFNTSFDGCD